MDLPHRQLVDIGGRVLCVRVRGQGPTVVLEAGGAGEGTRGAYGDGLEDQLAAIATVLTYDRAGSGRSDGPMHRRVTQMAEDLIAVIHATGCDTPVVIVGWSSGALVAEMFAVKHPDKVAGLVLLDPSETSTESWIGQRLLLAIGTIQLGALALASQLGLFRTRAGRSLVRRTSPAGTSDAGLEYLYCAANYPRAIWQSTRVMLLVGGYVRETAAALRVASLPDVPVRVVVPRLRAGLPAAWARVDAAHRALAERFPRGKLVLAERASHAVPIDQPEVVIGAVRDVLAPNPTAQKTQTD